MAEIKAKWVDIKSFVDSRKLSIQYLALVDKYLLTAIDSPYTLTMEMDRNPSDTTDLLDFETNYLPNGNGRVREEDFTVERRLKVDVVESNGAGVDAFGRKRVSNPNVIFGETLVGSSKPFLFSENLVGGGLSTYDINHSWVDLTTGLLLGDRALRQTKEYTRYIPSQSQTIYMSALLGAQQVGNIQRVGYFDDNDGIYFEQNGTDIRFSIRSSTSGVALESEFAIQAQWNVDKLDGSGLPNNPSGIILDTTQRLIYYIDFEWLAVGRVRCGFVIGGEIIIVHEFIHSNNGTDIYMKTPHLPMRWENVNDGTPLVATTLKEICGAVQSEGSAVLPEKTHSVNMGVSDILVPQDTMTPILSIRLKAINNRSQILPAGYELLMLRKENLFYEIRVNATLTGSVWQSAGINSIAEFDTTSTGISGGDLIHSGYMSEKGTHVVSNFKELFKLVSDYSGVVDTLTVSAMGIDGDVKLLSSIDFKEIV